MNSRIITYPSKVDKAENPTVVIIDATVDEVENVGLFLKTSQKDYDVYLYRGDLYDLEWLNYVSQDADYTLIRENSQVSIQNLTEQATFGPTQTLISPIRYFENQEPVDILG